MKIEIQIKSVSGDVLFELEKENNTLKHTLIEAVKNKYYLGDANLCGANLCGAYLCGANLCGAYLRGANLCGAYLRDAYLGDAYLGDANLGGAYLRGANLRDAYLRGAHLCGANLCGANLGGAYLRGAYLGGANLRDAYLGGAYLGGAYLRDADFSGAKINETTSFYEISCPEDGSFVGWKKANNYIIKLQITDNAKRSSSTSLKCRCSEARVLEIQKLDGSKSDISQISSNSDKNFIYKVGEIVKVDDFDNNRWNECSTGIHFFMNRNIAVNYEL